MSPRATDGDPGQGDPGHPDSGHRDTAHSGSGIGLTIARGIARAHGGDVTADSGGARQGRDLHPASPPGRVEGRLTPRSCPGSCSRSWAQKHGERLSGLFLDE